MTEKELLEKLKQSAELVEVPESLSPENILEKCRKLEQEKTDSEEKTDSKEKTDSEGKTDSVRNVDSGEKARKKSWIGNPRLWAGLSAAAVFIICCISLRGMELGKMAGSVSQESGAAPADMAAASAETSMAIEAEEAVEEGAEEEFDDAVDAGAGAGAQESSVERKNAGDLYTLAGSYDAVYEKLEEIKSADREMARYDMINGIATAEMEDSAMTSGIEELQQSIQKTSADKEEYSKTNVQTLGIDESDVVKTDGEYIYLLRGSSVSIVSAGDEEMKQVYELEVDMESATANVCAMYVDGDLLILMVQESLTSLEKEEDEDTAYYDMKYIDTDMVTSVLTYDIRNKEKPVLAGKMTQDGDYVTSRKDGSILYLFTSKYLMEDYGKEPESAIPEVNARKVSADCIYLGDRGERALVISSLSVNRPETVRDTVMILDSGSQIYMGEDSLYLYRGNYQGSGVTTEIAKFSLTGGYLNGEAAASVRGNVRDTFAIHEKDNKLRVLTTDSSGNDMENCLFLLDENLKVTGKLTHIAVGESIYAARYLGDMAYFITYRNTDPLFAADLSDEKNPKLVGELEITGFSEYLHFWGEDKLLGFGYETDPKSGAQKGLKLVMFDMSDPTALKILGTKVLGETSYSPALYEYKTMLADLDENLIGFVTEYYEKGVKRKYELYEWNGTDFRKILSENLNDGYDNADYRGLYIGARFYVAHPEVVRFYDRADYSLKQTLKMK